MSATGRGAKREEQDFYPTPAWCVKRLLERCELPSGKWLEPCAGDGSIIRAAGRHLLTGDRRMATTASWYGVELRPECEQGLLSLTDNRISIGSFLEGDPFEDVDRFDVILTNPPYTYAMEFVEMALMRAKNVAMLLRTNFLGSEDRWAFLDMFPPDIYQLPNRPSFLVVIHDHYWCPVCSHAQNVAEGAFPPFCKKCGERMVFHGKKQTCSDSTEYAWFVWPEERQRPRGEVCVLGLTPAAERKAAARTRTSLCVAA